MRMQLLLTTSVLFISLLLIGCGDTSDGREAISGKVTLKSQPLDSGMIQFLPTGNDQSTASGAIITNGSYSIPKDKGLKPGTYKVLISSGEPGTAAEEQAPGDSSQRTVAKERIPAKYNAESKEIIEVKKGGPNQFDYAIE